MKKKSINDLIEEFETKSKDAVSENRPIWDGDPDDEVYSVDIHIWRKPGMGNSLQTIAGNKLSILTATASFLNTLLIKDVATVEELRVMVNMVLENHGGNKL